MKKFIIALLFVMSQAASAVVSGDTLVETMDGSVALERLARGNQILSIAEGSAPYHIKPKAQTVVYTSGIAIENERAVTIVFGDNNQTLVVSLDQPVLTENGIIKRAGVLVVNDKLINREGDNVDIKYLALGTTNAFMVGIAPASNFVTENLFLANGVYLGSYKVEMHMHDHIIIRAFLGMEF